MKKEAKGRAGQTDYNRLMALNDELDELKDELKRTNKKIDLFFIGCFTFYLTLVLKAHLRKE